MLMLSVIMSASALFSSCDPEEEYEFYSPLLGSWVLVEDNYGPVVNEYDRSYFTFYSSGEGVYESYDVDGYEITASIAWETNDDLLYVYIWDELWRYRWYVSGSKMVLMSIDGDGARLVFRMY